MTRVLTLGEIRIRGFEVLLRELGAAGAVRFMQQYESGRGDYTRDRHTWLQAQSVRELGQAIQSRRNT
ncbi:MAG: hypothetical protein WHS87_00915 [Anaerolineales bacterium]